MKNKLNTLLNGINTKSNTFDCRNVPIMFAMQSYILSTKRFDPCRWSENEANTGVNYCNILLIRNLESFIKPK